MDAFKFTWLHISHGWGGVGCAFRSDASGAGSPGRAARPGGERLPLVDGVDGMDGVDGGHGHEVWLKMKEPGQTAGFSPWFHLPCHSGTYAF